MKIELKFPMPDHHPAAAFEYLTGYGYVAHVDPVLNQVTYELEANSLVELVRRVDEIEHEIGCYDWWTEKIDLFEQAQDMIDEKKLGVVDLNAKQVKWLKSLLGKIEKGRLSTVLSAYDQRLAGEVLPVLKTFKPAQTEEMKSV